MTGGSCAFSPLELVVSHPLLNAPIGRSLFRLAGPTTAVMVGQVGVAVSEAWIVAQVGIDALAAIALVIPAQAHNSGRSVPLCGLTDRIVIMSSRRDHDRRRARMEQQSSADAKQLARFGYRSEFKREFGSYSLCVVL